VRWGILGPGRISRAFLTGLRDSRSERAVAVGSSDPGRAQAVAGEFGVPRWYAGYADVLADPEVDAVYIGLPNSAHAEWTVAAARAGKHILCEKPLARDRAEAESMFAAADEHGVRLTEAFMYRFHPRTLRLAELLATGAVGEVRFVQATFTFTIAGPADIRLRPELAGGALMDVGCYCVNITRLAAGGAPIAVSGLARWAETGVDATFVGTLSYATGLTAQIACSMDMSLHQNAEIIGTTGSIGVPTTFGLRPDQPSTLVLRRPADGSTEVIDFPPVNQYRLEAEGFAAGLPGMPRAESLDNASTIEALLRSAREAPR
jgi:D-xylose 1-dehydrogenase (NADP+, D-xylono-1,5-lactone-forming)